MAATVWNNSSDSPQYYDNVNNVQKNTPIVRLVEDPDIKKTIEFDELSVALTNSTSSNGTSQVNTVGNDYPIIRINDLIVGKNDIKRLEIKSEGFIPTIDIMLKLPTTSMITKNMPKDGDIVSIFMRTNTDAVNYLRNDYVITSCSTSVNPKSSGTAVSIAGKLFIEGIDTNRVSFGIKGTSKTAFKELAKRFGLGFSYNDPDDTNDGQIWICCDTPETFAAKITEHAWKDPVSFFKSWVDFYYNICFVNVNKFLLSSQNPEDKIDLTFNSSTIAFNEMVYPKSSTEDAAPMVKVLSNDPSFKGSPFFIKKWKPINNATEISISQGYETMTTSFIHNQNLYNTYKEDCFETLRSMPTYDRDKLDSYIIFRGRAHYDPNKNPDDEQARVNYNSKKTYITRKWTGVEYKMDEDEDLSDNNTWSGNVHQNYSNAVIHNNMNIAELNKMYIEVDCEGLLLQVMRGERVPVYIMYNNAIDRNSAPEGTGAEANRFYSGFYVVDSISYEYKDKKADGFSAYTTHMKLTRREWPTPEMIQKDNNSLE